MHIHVSSLLLFIVCFSLLSTPSSVFAHGEAVLCDNRGDLIEQCGEEHECIIDEQVNENIGYCKAVGESIVFQMCDRQAEGMGCDEGEVCKIGTLDPQIGVCASVSHSLPNASESEMSTDDAQTGCQTTHSSPSLILWTLILMGLSFKRSSAGSEANLPESQYT